MLLFQLGNSAMNAPQYWRRRNESSYTLIYSLPRQVEGRGGGLVCLIQNICIVPLLTKAL
jgi:hypothetical protein